MRTRITLECTECKHRNYNMTISTADSANHTRCTRKQSSRRKEVDKMSEKTRTQKKSWFKGLQAEFKKIIWPDKKTLARQTTAVVAVSVILGIVIAVVDVILRYGIDLLVR